MSLTQYKIDQHKIKRTMARRVARLSRSRRIESEADGHRKKVIKDGAWMERISATQAKAHEAIVANHARMVQAARSAPKQGLMGKVAGFFRGRQP